MKAEKTERSYIRPLLLGAAIFAILFSHFAVSQFISFQSENDSVITEVSSKPAVEVKTEYETSKPDMVTTPKTSVAVSPLFEQEPERIVPRQAAMRQTVIKKKETPRESKAERLRRAERLLTGI